ncbi:rhodanese-like domain-containing protein [Aquipseudomonas alcaligenes]|uniref:rhodanese-like domain-containing protein n=1 Tax=Aquipseudomonas alcaligenes TaxID=43263 RepID=UPI003748E910
MRHLLLCLGLALSPLAALAGDIDQAAALSALQQPNAVLIDVRTQEEFAAGALPGASLIPHEQIAQRIAAVAPDKNAPVVLYCRSGRRSGIAQDRLLELGYSNVINAGGYEQLQPLLKDR